MISIINRPWHNEGQFPIDFRLIDYKLNDGCRKNHFLWSFVMWVWSDNISERAPMKTDEQDISNYVPMLNDNEI